ncbi:23108_t:CDS:2, partial [Racocetra persica]
VDKVPQPISPNAGTPSLEPVDLKQNTEKLESRTSDHPSLNIF